MTAIHEKDLMMRHNEKGLLLGQEDTFCQRFCNKSGNSERGNSDRIFPQLSRFFSNRLWF